LHDGIGDLGGIALALFLRFNHAPSLAGIQRTCQPKFKVAHDPKM
jgi:hypothetical protein